MRSVLTLATLLVIGVLPACNAPVETADPEPARKNQPLEELSEVQEAQKETALAARDKLFSSLFQELTGAMADGGPAASIEVCKTRASELAREVAQETGVRIGRTSFRLRNPENEPPRWARRYVADRIEREQYVGLADDALGVLLPIRLQDTCLQCHGNEEQIQPEVRDAILALYPEDSATEFAEGDLRGYFWIEVPAD